MPEILKAAGNTTADDIAARAAEILAAGGIIAYPTETFYGLGADAANERAVRRVYAVKGRNFHNPLSVIIGKEELLYGLVEEIPAPATLLMKSFWPGALTIVFKAAACVSTLLTAGTGKIGVRISSHAAARAIAFRLGHPVTATSANISQAPECSTAEEVINQIGNKLDAVVDLGRTAGGLGSTIIDVTFHPAKILRPGVLTADTIAEIIPVAR